MPEFDTKPKRSRSQARSGTRPGRAAQGPQASGPEAGADGTHPTRPVNFSSQQLGSAILEVRRLRGMTRKQLAELVGISENYLGMIETGVRHSDQDRSVSLPVLNRIAEHLGVPTQWLMILASESSTQSSEYGKKIDRTIDGIKEMITLWIVADTKKMRLLDARPSAPGGEDLDGHDLLGD